MFTGRADWVARTGGMALFQQAPTLLIHPMLGCFFIHAHRGTCLEPKKHPFRPKAERHLDTSQCPDDPARRWTGTSETQLSRPTCGRDLWDLWAGPGALSGFFRSSVRQDPNGPCHQAGSPEIGVSGFRAPSKAMVRLTTKPCHTPGPKRMTKGEGAT